MQQCLAQSTVKVNFLAGPDSSSRIAFLYLANRLKSLARQQWTNSDRTLACVGVAIGLSFGAGLIGLGSTLGHRFSITTPVVEDAILCVNPCAIPLCPRAVPWHLGIGCNFPSLVLVAIYKHCSYRAWSGSTFSNSFDCTCSKGSVIDVARMKLQPKPYWLEVVELCTSICSFRCMRVQSSSLWHTSGSFKNNMLQAESRTDRFGCEEDERTLDAALFC